MICNWGILGAGFISTHAVIPAIQHSRNGRVRAIASRDLARAGALAAQCGAERAYGDYAELLADPEIDAIYLALPNSLHGLWTIQAARAGKHVLCEKPLACSADEETAMLEACQSAGVHLMEAAMYRFHPRMERLKQLLDEGAVGDPRLLHSAFSFTLKDPQNYRNSPDYGGGALLDVGFYCVNSLCWLNGAAPVAVQAFTTYREHGGIDLTTSALLSFANGALGHIQCSFATAEHQTIEIVGSSGTIRVRLPFTAWHENATSLTFQRADGMIEEHFAPADPYQLMVEHFVDAIQGETALCYEPQMAIQTLEVLDRIRAEEQRSVS